MSKTYFFCGVGGSGMSALAIILLNKNHKVYGSDRGYDRGESPEKFKALEQDGVQLCPQDGSGITQNIDVLVVSSAVESSVPDVAKALDLNVSIQKRAEVLAELFNGSRGIAIAGTSGKTTVTGMVSHMLCELELDPSFMNGGQIVNFMEQGLPGNARAGGSDLFVSEMDESDGSVALFNPAIAVLNNITLDHKPLDELRPLFTDFIKRARETAIINLDDPEAVKLVDVHDNTITYSVDNPAATITATDLCLPLSVPGQHNVSNALAALCVAQALGLPLKLAAKALAGFKGIKRRFEVVGTRNDITVIDDFAHNPDKIEATLKTLKEQKGRVLAIFQPHGFGPTKMLKDGLVQTFIENMSGDDMLLMPEIYYAGGTADKCISSRDIIDAVSEGGKQAQFFESRAEIQNFLINESRPHDRIVIMGARDDTLSDLARGILSSLKQKAA